MGYRAKWNLLWWSTAVLMFIFQARKSSNIKSRINTEKWYWQKGKQVQKRCRILSGNHARSTLYCSPIWSWESALDEILDCYRVIFPKFLHAAFRSFYRQSQWAMPSSLPFWGCFLLWFLIGWGAFVLNEIWQFDSLSCFIFYLLFDFQGINTVTFSMIAVMYRCKCSTSVQYSTQWC